MVAKRNRKRDIHNLTYGLEARVIEEKQDFKQFGTRSATWYLSNSERYETDGRTGCSAWVFAADDGRQPFTLSFAADHRSANWLFFDRGGFRLHLCSVGRANFPTTAGQHRPRRRPPGHRESTASDLC